MARTAFASYEMEWNPWFIGAVTIETNRLSETKTFRVSRVMLTDGSQKKGGKRNRESKPT